MDLRRGLARSLRLVRKVRGFTHDRLSDVWGRTYIGEVERGLKNPTVKKLDQLSRAMDVHPLTVLTLMYLPNLRDQDLAVLLDRVHKEAKTFIAKAEDIWPRKARSR